MKLQRMELDRRASAEQTPLPLSPGMAFPHGVAFHSPSLPNIATHQQPLPASPPRVLPLLAPKQHAPVKPKLTIQPPPQQHLVMVVKPLLTIQIPPLADEFAVGSGSLAAHIQNALPADEDEDFEEVPVEVLDDSCIELGSAADSQVSTNWIAEIEGSVDAAGAEVAEESVAYSAYSEVSSDVEAAAIRACSTTSMRSITSLEARSRSVHRSVDPLTVPLSSLLPIPPHCVCVPAPATGANSFPEELPAAYRNLLAPASLTKGLGIAVRLNDVASEPIDTAHATGAVTRILLDCATDMCLAGQLQGELQLEETQPVDGGLGRLAQAKGPSGRLLQSGAERGAGYGETGCERMNPAFGPLL